MTGEEHLQHKNELWMTNQDGAELRYCLEHHCLFDSTCQHENRTKLSEETDDDGDILELWECDDCHQQFEIDAGNAVDRQMETDPCFGCDEPYRPKCCGSCNVMDIFARRREAKERDVGRDTGYPQLGYYGP